MARQVFLPLSIHPEIELICQRSAPNQSRADLPQGNFAVRARATARCRQRQSRLRRRCDNFSWHVDCNVTSTLCKAALETYEFAVAEQWNEKHPCINSRPATNVERG